ncbi:sugar phosphate nucleotidyltransferase [Candidatus Neomarinimicrobiota bacterium]
MSEQFDVVILAAGIGARIKGSGNSLPKCLLKLDKQQTILSRQINQLFAVKKVDRIIIATGFEHDSIEEYLKAEFDNITQERILLEYNPFFSISNNLVSLWNIRGLIATTGNGIMISNGDNVYGMEFSDLADDLPPDNLVVIRKKGEYDGDDMKVVIKDDKILQINKNITSNNADGEAIGLSKFNATGKKMLFRVLDDMVQNPRHLSSFYLRAFEYLIEFEGLSLFPHDCQDMFFEEIDFPDDYKKVVQSLPK